MTNPSSKTVKRYDAMDAIESVDGNGFYVLASEYDVQVADIERLTDLVRHQRGELFSEGLLSHEEFAALVADSEGGQRVARLEGYDRIRAGLKEAEASNASLVERVGKLEGALQECMEVACAETCDHPAGSSTIHTPECIYARAALAPAEDKQA